MSTIYISGVFDMPDHVERYLPRYLLSVIQPAFQPERPPEIAEEDHLRVAVHDIWQAEPGSVLPGSSHVERIVEFAKAWQPDLGAVHVHCYAGVSRSTATALILHAVQTGDPLESARALRAAAPHAAPNRRIIELADALLDWDGGLQAAVQSMGPRSELMRDEYLTILEL
ncbi:MAG: protein tyrosine phosphatase [Acidobacteriota bacterium]